MSDDASRTDLESLPDHVLSGDRFLSQGAIGFEDERDGFLQVGAGFVQGGALGIRAGELLNKCDVSLGNSAENGGELKIHDGMIRGSFRLRAPGRRDDPSRFVITNEVRDLLLLATGHWQLVLEETAMVLRAAAGKMKEAEWEAWVVGKVGKRE